MSKESEFEEYWSEYCARRDTSNHHLVLSIAKGKHARTWNAAFEAGRKSVEENITTNSFGQHHYQRGFADGKKAENETIEITNGSVNRAWMRCTGFNYPAHAEAQIRMMKETIAELTRQLDSRENVNIRCNYCGKDQCVVAPYAPEQAKQPHY